MPELVNMSVGSLPGTSGAGRHHGVALGGEEVQKGLADVGDGGWAVHGGLVGFQLRRMAWRVMRQTLYFPTLLRHGFGDLHLACIGHFGTHGQVTGGTGGRASKDYA